MLAFRAARTSRSRFPAATFALLACSCVLSACAALVAANPTGTPPFDVYALVPKLVPSGQTVEMQRHGAVVITLAATRFDTMSVAGCTYAFARQAIISTMPMSVSTQTHAKLIETRYADLTVMPNQLSFLLTIKNQMNRVFRGDGAVVQFSADQRVQAVSQANYVDFINTIIPPGGESQIRISGPSLSALSDSTMLGVSLFDVVTQIDDAGRVAKRENFSWYFRVSRQRISSRVVGRDRNVWVPRSEMSRVVRVARDGSAAILPTKVCIESAVPG